MSDAIHSIFRLDIQTGNVYLNDLVLPFNSSKSLKDFLDFHKFTFQNKDAEKRQDFGLTVSFLGKPFGLYILFIDGQLYNKGVQLTWREGVASRGWEEVGQEDILEEKNFLSQLLSSSLGLQAGQESRFNVDFFELAWGKLSAGCSLQNMSVSIGAQWNETFTFTE
jgi:hypothetical protein